MAKFAMYVVCTDEGGDVEVHGSNDVELVRDFIDTKEAEGCVCAIIHSTYGDWQYKDGAATSIEELPTAADFHDEDAEDD